MKRPDCGNHRTGQPRCAQLTAKTWNCSPSKRRTQHAVSTVFPSVGITFGFRNVASRVSPSGNSRTDPRGTHDRYALHHQRLIEDRTNPPTGTASADATKPLKRIPNFMNSPRRESVFSFDIVELLMLRVIRRGICRPRIRRALRGKPSNYIRDFLFRHRFAGNISAPVGSAKFGSTGNDNGAQILIADEREKYIIRQGASLRSTATVRTVARLAVGLEYERPLRGTSHGLCKVGRWVGSFKNSWFAPARSNSVRDRINLFVRQHPAGTLCETRHGRSTYAACCSFLDRNIVRDSQINRIAERSGCASSPFRAVATGAVLRVQSRKIRNLVRSHCFRVLARLAVS